MQLSREQVARIDGKEGASSDKHERDDAKKMADDEGSFLMPPAYIPRVHSPRHSCVHADAFREQDCHCKHARHCLGDGQALQPGAGERFQDVEAITAK